MTDAFRLNLVKSDLINNFCTFHKMLLMIYNKNSPLVIFQEMRKIKKKSTDYNKKLLNHI